LNVEAGAWHVHFAKAGCAAESFFRSRSLQQSEDSFCVVDRSAGSLEEFAEVVHVRGVDVADDEVADPVFEPSLG
jgi:hypothetical protein